MTTAWAMRKERIHTRLRDLEKAVADGGKPHLRSWELREQIMQTLERLPRNEMNAWLAERRQVREFIEAQSPPSTSP